MVIALSLSDFLPFLIERRLYSCTIDLYLPVHFLILIFLFYVHT